MTPRRRKWLIGVALAAIVLAVGAWVAYLQLLPWIVRREVNSAFASVGLANVKFDVEQASLFGTRIEGTGAGDDDAVGIGDVSVRYSPWDAINGELRSITVSNARLEIDLDEPLTLGAGAKNEGGASDASFELPFERLELNRCALVLKRGGQELRLPIDGSIIRRADAKDAADLTITSAIATSNLHVSGAIDGAAGRAHFTASASDVNLERLLALLPPDVTRDVDDAGGKVTFALDYRFDAGKSSASLQLALADVFVDATRALGISLRGAGGAVTFDDLLAPSTPPQQTLTVNQLVVAGQDMSNLVLAFQLAPPQQLTVGQLKFNWAGGVAQAQPFTVDLSAPVIATTLYLDRAALRDVVALITAGRATGQGTVSGSLPFSIDLAQQGAPHVEIGEGSFHAVADGNLRLGESAEDLGELMERENPGFGSDPVLRDLQSDVLQAVQDFDYHRLEVGFRRDASGNLVTELKIHGRGRENRLPINLNLSVTGADEALNAYLAAKSRVFGK
jgi:hypothetical protein